MKQRRFLLLMDVLLISHLEFSAKYVGYVCVCVLCRSENFLLLRDVLQRIGMRREKFMSTYADEVIVHEIGQKTSDHRLTVPDDDDSVMTKSSASATRVEFVRMSDVIRRLLNIDISLVSTVDCDAITHASHL